MDNGTFAVGAGAAGAVFLGLMALLTHLEPPTPKPYAWVPEAPGLPGSPVVAVSLSGRRWVPVYSAADLNARSALEPAWRLDVRYPNADGFFPQWMEGD